MSKSGVRQIPRCDWYSAGTLAKCECSAKATGEALSICFSLRSHVSSSGDPLIEFLTFFLSTQFDRQYRFSQELQNGTITIYDWAMTAEKVLQNPNIAR